MDDTSSTRLAERLRRLRQDRGWSLERLAERSGVSRATLSRLENAEVSPTTELLGKLCPIYGLTLSRLLAMVEDAFTPVVPREQQLLWSDPDAGFRRRSVSPPARSLAAEVLECELDPDAHIAYDAPPLPGLEHHLVLLEGRLEVTVEGTAYPLSPGDCLRYQLHGATEFRTPPGIPARYLLILV